MLIVDFKYFKFILISLAKVSTVNTTIVDLLKIHLLHWKLKIYASLQVVLQRYNSEKNHITTTITTIDYNTSLKPPILTEYLIST